MGRRSNEQRQQRRQQEGLKKAADNMQARIAKLQPFVGPDQRITTCSTCGYMMIIPNHMAMVSHVVGRGQIHPGAITKYGIA